MGKPCFSKIAKIFAIALLGAAATIVAIAVLSSSAAADPSGGGGGDGTLYRWDTDNLNYSGRGAVAFNIPFHKYGGYSGVAACQKNVADSFFQTDNSVVNDFPRLVPSGNANNVTWSLAAGSAGNNAGCDTFVAQQDRLATQVAAGVLYSLGSDSKLVAAPTGNAYTTGRSAADLSYVAWTAKAASGYTVTKTDNFQTIDTIGATSDPSYLRRVDGLQPPDGNRRAISPSTATWTVPSVSSSNTGNFGQRWHGTRLVTTITTPGYFTGGSGHYECSGTQIGNTCYGTSTWVWDVPQTYVPESTVNRRSDVRVSAAGNVARHLTAAKSRDLCPSLFHPRGEDSVSRIGSQTGRTLTSLSHNLGKVADRFWCRSDWRYARRFAAEHHTGVTEAQRHPQARNIAVGTVFSAYGRLGCYYTTTGQKLITSSAAYECGYKFPLPRCDSDKDGTADREYTAAEVQALRDNGTIAVGQPFTIAENARCDPAAPPPSLAGFTADACVTASLEIYENRIAGGDAEPGIPASDRTLAVSAGRTAWDLDITSPHPLTASPPKDTGDASGCADGSENRADHAASSGAAARSQTTVPSYASSARTDTAAPPNDADGDIDYSGAVRNMAHRYASKVAESTCSVKRAEAEAELALLEAREAAFTRWLSDYKTAADSNAAAMRNYRRVLRQSGAQLLVLQFNDIESNKAAYAAAKAPLYTALSGVLATAKTNYDTTTDRTTGSNRAAVIPSASDSGCVAHYDGEIARLKALFAAAEKTATDAIKSAETAVGTARLGSVPQITSSSVPAVRLPDISAVLSRTETTRECIDDWNPPYCTRPPRQGEDCGFGCAGSWRTIVTRYYTCPGHSGYVVSGTFSGSYKTTRSRNYTGTYTASSRGESTSTICPGWRFSGTTATDAAAWVMGTAPSPSRLPRLSAANAAEALQSLDKLAVLGSYHSGHSDRANLEASSADTRNSAASFTATAGTASGPAAEGTWQTAYKTAYDTAFTQATGHMSGTSWNNFDWRYETSTLAWGSYQEDGATTFSASTATPRDGTGCDLISVASDGTVSVEATRLDYETSSYGKGSVYGTRTDAQRTCKIRRTRTPELLLMYAPSVVSGTDTSKTSDSRLDSDSTATNAEFFYVDYQPTSAAERFKLYGEAEVFALKASLADSAPVLCYQPGEALVAHVGAKKIEAVHKAVFLHASGFAGGNKKHCYRHPSAVHIGSKPAFAFFDDTAHSAMDSVNVVWQQPSTKIVSKLGSTDDLKMMANSVALVANTVAYADATRTSSFYGTYYTFPTDSSTESPSGWDITGHPTLTLTSTFRQHVVQAKDAAAKTPTTHAMVFKFVDCVFGIEDVAFVDNIASPYALLSEDGVVPSGWKQTYDSDPHSSPTGCANLSTLRAWSARYFLSLSS